MNDIAVRLAKIRKELGLTQEDLAVKAGVSQGTIGNIEARLRHRPRELLSIAAALGVTPEWLQNGTIDNDQQVHIEHPDMIKRMLHVISDAEAIATSFVDDEHHEGVREHRAALREIRAFLTKIDSGNPVSQGTGQLPNDTTTDSVRITVEGRRSSQSASDEVQSTGEIAEVIDRAFSIGFEWSRTLNGHVYDARDVLRTLTLDILEGLPINYKAVDAFPGCTKDDGIVQAKAEIVRALIARYGNEVTG